MFSLKLEVQFFNLIQIEVANMIWNCILYAIKEIELNQKIIIFYLKKSLSRKTMNVGLTTKKFKKKMHKHLFKTNKPIGLIVIDKTNKYIYIYI